MKETVYESGSPEETREIASLLASKAMPGDVFTLDGDLGVGKTVFTQGFAKGLEIDDTVNSPTFTIIQEYTSGRLPLYHFDVYRIGDIEEMEEVGFDDYIYSEGVSLIEWAQLIEELIPTTAKHIYIQKDLTKGFDYRKITLKQV